MPEPGWGYPRPMGGAGCRRWRWGRMTVSQLRVRSMASMIATSWPGPQLITSRCRSRL